jgi:hypothetical protein
VAALGALFNRLHLNPQGLLFHRDYSYKSCPGSMVTKEWIIPQIEAWIAHYRGEVEEELQPAEAEEAAEPAPVPLDAMSLRAFVESLAVERMSPVNPDAALYKKAVELGLLGPISDEIPFEADGQAYIIQLFMDALIVPIGQWDQIQRLQDVSDGDD